MEDDNLRSEPGLFRAVARVKWVVVLLVVLGAVAGYAYAAQGTERYAATATLLLADPRTQTTLVESRTTGSDPGRYVRNQARVVTSQPVLELAASSLGVPVDTLEVSAEAQLDVDSISVRAVDTDPQRAADTADAVAQAYEDYRTAQTEESTQQAVGQLVAARLEIEAQLRAIEAAVADDPSDAAALAEREAATQQLQVLLTRERQLTIDTALFGGGVELTEAAAVPGAPFEPRPARTAAAAALLSFAYASVGAWWWGRLRPDGVGKSRMERVLGVPLLGEVPTFTRSLGPFPTAASPLSVEAEAYQFVLAAVSRAMRARGATTLLVTSPGPGEGKTSTAINLAVVAARTGHRMVLVDADVRVQGLSQATGVAPAVFLQDLARGGMPTRMALSQPEAPGLESLSVAVPDVASDSDDPAVFLRSPGFGQALAQLGEVAETVVVDSPPVLAVADTFAMAPVVDAVLLVVSPLTSEDTLEEVRRRLDLAGASLLGYVVNRSETRTQAYGYGAGRRPGRLADGRAREAAHGRGGGRHNSAAEGAAAGRLPDRSRAPKDGAAPVLPLGASGSDGPAGASASSAGEASPPPVRTTTTGLDALGWPRGAEGTG